ncbi:MAG: hypothetical protein LC792_25410 [Actinobacteria bacterium]|nr:hypothetical protein [Actinomycetota bacterium]
MHPNLMEEMARLRQGELLREAERLRRTRSMRSPAAGRAGWQRTKAVVGNRMVAAGWRLLKVAMICDHRRPWNPGGVAERWVAAQFLLPSCAIKVWRGTRGDP